MNIALIAHDTKKELMVQFCIAYCGILSRHNLCATGTTGKLVSEATGLKITCFMAGSQGGDQQISSRISCNEIDLLLYFRNPIGAKATEPDEASLLRLCDVYNIPYATNIASAEAMIHALETATWIGAISSTPKSKNRHFAPPFRYRMGDFAFRGVMGRSPRRRSRRCGQRPQEPPVGRFGLRPAPAFNWDFPFPQTCAKINHRPAPLPPLYLRKEDPPYGHPHHPPPRHQ